MKVAIVGGAGVRTPLLVHGLLDDGAPPLGEVALLDPDRGRLETVARLCRAVIAARGGACTISTPETLEAAVTDARFVVLSLRVGGMAARARDEGIALAHGLTGQETTGPAGLAMALRTLPVILEQARCIERCAPRAWVINFTNPAGLIAQALAAHTRLQVVGICDTPSELFHGIARALGQPESAVRCDYLGINHLGWVSRVWSAGEDCLGRLLADDEALRGLYPATLFAPELLRALHLLPSEYLFFYLGRRRARSNQVALGASRGEELARLNDALFARLAERFAAGDEGGALTDYRDYLGRRSASYLQLEAHGASALGELRRPVEDPFAAATGYHRIALAVIAALGGARPARLVVNTVNRGAIAELEAEDVVEVPCLVDAHGVAPLATAGLPPVMRGLVQAVKASERLAIAAALEGSRRLAREALLVNPLIGDWDLAGQLLDALAAADPEHLGSLLA